MSARIERGPVILQRIDCDLKQLALTAVDGFVLSQLDGQTDLETIAEISGLDSNTVEVVAERLVKLGAARDPNAPKIVEPRARVVSAGMYGGITEVRRRDPRAEESIPPPKNAERSKSVRPPKGTERSKSIRPPKMASSMAPPMSEARPTSARQPTRPASMRPPKAASARKSSRPPPPAAVPAPVPEVECELDAETLGAIAAIEARIAQGDHYVIFGVARDSDKKGIKRAYFELARVYHPDRFFGKKLGDVRARLGAIFVKLTHAHDVLTDRDRRKGYDATLPPVKSVAPVSSPAPTAPPLSAPPPVPTQARASAPAPVSTHARASAPAPTHARASAPVAAPLSAPAPAPASVPSSARASAPAPVSAPGSVRVQTPVPVAPPVSAPIQVPSTAARPSRKMSKAMKAVAREIAATQTPDPDAAQQDAARRKRLLGRLNASASYPSAAKAARVAVSASSPASSGSFASEESPSSVAGRRLREGIVAAQTQARIDLLVKAAEAALAANDIIGAVNNYRLALEHREDSRLRFIFEDLDARARAVRFDKHVSAGVAAEREMRWADAAVFLQQALEAKPDCDIASRAATALRLSGGDMERATALAEQAVAMAPHNPNYHLALAAIYLVTKSAARAKEECETARKLAPKDEHIQALALEIAKKA